jgi:hypothetical protein
MGGRRLTALILVVGAMRWHPLQGDRLPYQAVGRISFRVCPNLVRQIKADDQPPLVLLGRDGHAAAKVRRMALGPCRQRNAIERFGRPPPHQDRLIKATIEPLHLHEPGLPKQLHQLAGPDGVVP